MLGKRAFPLEAISLVIYPFLLTAIGTSFLGTTGEDDADKLVTFLRETALVGAGIELAALPGNGILSSALSNHEDGEGIIGESMNGISTSKSLSSSCESSIESGMNGARSS